MVRVLDGREDVRLLRSRHHRGYNCATGSSKCDAKYPTVPTTIHGRSMIGTVSMSTIIIIFVCFTTIELISVSGYITYCNVHRCKHDSIGSKMSRKLRFVFAERRHGRHQRMTIKSSSSSPDDSYPETDDAFVQEEISNQRNEFSVSNRPYWEQSDDDDEEDDRYRRTQQQQAPSQPNDFLENEVLNWEKYITDSGTAWILLPPLSVTKPTCILHFVGGTFMGSAPHIWYRTLLQDLVRHTSCAIVATSIPVTIARSPLNHVRLSTQLLDQFRIVYQDVMIDEYGRDALQSVPICGMGHSLGARLLAVSTTLTLGQIQPSRKSQASLSYKSMILISFTNYGAAAGIPGVATLFRKSRNIERQAQQRKTTKRTRSDSKWWDDEDEDEENGYNFDDENTWSSLWDEVSDVVQLGATSIQNALTPPSESLEFHPTPEQLWTAVQTNGRYSIPHTLLVQFDDDEIDQSARFATAILNCSDVKFARLRGTHLTPIARSDPPNTDKRTRKDEVSFMQQMNTQAERILAKALQGRHESKRNALSFLELRQSIARYIIEIVTK